MTLLALEQAFPGIPWREPVKVITAAGEGYFCRVCIAMQGLHGSEVPALARSREDVIEHFKGWHDEDSNGAH